MRTLRSRLLATAAFLMLLLASPAPVGAQGTAAAASARGTVTTAEFWAQSLGVRKSIVVYLPPSYATATSRRYPLLVYLHGLTGDERNWSQQGRLAESMDSLVAAGHPEAIVVMPDGDDGWYTTWHNLPDAACARDTTRREPAASYCVPWPHYDDYIASDVVRWADRQFRTFARGERRGIGGLSMGGYGAVSLALGYPTVFAAAASHSGVVSPRLLAPKPYPKPPYTAGGVTPQYARNLTELERSASPRLFRYMAPAFGRDTIGWIARDPGRRAARLVGGTAARRVPALYLDCGTEDTYLDQNRDLHRVLTRLGVRHQYTEPPGNHSWAYWRARVPHSLAFLLQATRGS